MKKSLTAALLALTLALASALPALAAEDTGFADVAAGDWYAEAVLYCRDTGLMGGTGGDRFSPEGLMTRAMLCTVLYRAAGSPPAESSGFADVAEGSWYGPAVAWAAKEGLVDGFTDGTFRPESPLTREQLAVILWRAAGSPAAEAGRDYADEGDISPWAAEAADWARENRVLSGDEENRFQPLRSATRAHGAQVLMNYTLLPGTRSVVSAIDVLCRPGDIVPLAEGGFLVTDSYHKVVWKVQAGTSRVYAGALEEEPGPFGPVGGYNDGALDRSLFREPWALAPFLGGWALSDPENHAVRLLLPEGVQTLNCSTRENLKKTAVGVVFERPTGLAADEEGNLYIADTGMGAVRKVSTAGEVTTLADHLQEPMGLCWLDGALYVAETSAHRVLRITPDKKVAVVAGTGGEGLLDGPADRAALSSPTALTAGPDGTLYIADTGNSAVRYLKDGQVGTLAVRDPASTEEFFPIVPAGMAVSGRRLFICDRFSRKVITIALG